MSPFTFTTTRTQLFPSPDSEKGSMKPIAWGNPGGKGAFLPSDFVPPFPSHANMEWLTLLY